MTTQTSVTATSITATQTSTSTTFTGVQCSSSPCRNLGRCFAGDLQGTGLYYYGRDTEWDHPGYTCVCAAAGTAGLQTTYGTDCERTVFDHGGTLPYADLTGSIVVTERVSDTWQSQDSEIVILFLGLYLIHPIASISVPWIAHASVDGGIVEITVLIKNVTVADSRGVNVAEEMQARLAALNSSTFPGSELARLLGANYAVNFPESGIVTTVLGSEQTADTNFFGLTETMFYAVAGAIAFLLVVIITLLVCCCCTDGEYGYDNDGVELSTRPYVAGDQAAAPVSTPAHYYPTGDIGGSGSKLGQNAARRNSSEMARVWPAARPIDRQRRSSWNSPSVSPAKSVDVTMEPFARSATLHTPSHTRGSSATSPQQSGEGYLRI